MKVEGNTAIAAAATEAAASNQRKTVRCAQSSLFSLIKAAVEWWRKEKNGYGWWEPYGQCAVIYTQQCILAIECHKSHFYGHEYFEIRCVVYVYQIINLTLKYIEPHIWLQLCCQLTFKTTQPPFFPRLLFLSHLFFAVVWH